jgi:sugar O-acyltransferase (sialic acid O-acetyltransferase NeuD family)
MISESMDKIVLVGGGGHARVLIELIRSMGRYEIIGVLDSKLKIGLSILGISVLGKDNLLSDLYNKGVKNACIGVGSVNKNDKRKRLYEKVRKIGFNVPELVHPQSIVSNESKISEGVQVMAGAIIQTHTILNPNTIINTGAIVEHDCIIGKHVHICPGVVISGGCIIGDAAFIGAGATVIQGVKIGREALIGAGSVVVRDVPDGAVVKRVPPK